MTRRPSTTASTSLAAWPEPGAARPYFRVKLAPERRRRNHSFSLSPVRGRWQPDPDEPRGSKFPAVGIVTCSNHAPGLTTEEEPARQAPIETGVDEKGPGRVRAIVAQSSQSSHASCVLSSSSCTSSSS
jgi:hypothetical protein